MAMVNSYNSKMRKSLPKQIMLKDYLLDDLSSCSSNGFLSFSRRPCCASTVPFPNPNHKKQKTLKKTKPKSLLHRATSAVINTAVKLLSSAATKPPENSPGPSKTRASVLPRSLSKRLKRWKSIKYLTITNTPNDEVNNGVDYGYFNCDYLQCSGGYCVSRNENDIVSGGERALPKEEVAGGEVVTVGGNSNEGGSVASTPATSSAENKWQNEEAKEQFSPVCVLDFTSTDEEEISSPEEVSSPFQSRLACVEGRKKKLIHKLQRFEGLAKLKPMDLSKKFSLSKQTDDSPSPSPFVHDNIASIKKGAEVEQDGDEIVRCKVSDLLDQMKTMLENIKFDWGLILYGFFVEGVRERNGNLLENELIFEARDWMNGNPRESLVGWEEAKNRIPYMRDMEKGGKWNIRAFDEHKEELAFELEVEILALLVNELVLDLI